MTNSKMFQTNSKITFENHWDHFLARVALNRMGHRVQPGLYALGHPDARSQVFVTANYTLSFDALRSTLNNQDAYILVLDTKGINVWCAAGEGTFGTEELINRIKTTELPTVVHLRQLILPQLGATGVSAYQVKQLSGFDVEFGPVRAEDLPEYLKTHQATPQMRLVRFNLIDRLILIPVELANTFVPIMAAAIALYFLGGWLYALWIMAAWLAGTVLFFILLPWMPTREFSTNGFILGGLVSIPFAIAPFTRTENSIWFNLMRVLPMFLAMPAMTAFITLTITGSTPITSRTGVRREIFRYIPVMAWMAAGSILLTTLRLFGLGK